MGSLQNQIGGRIICHNTLFTIEQLHEVLKKTKLGKQPGPNQVVMELYKWLDAVNRQRTFRSLDS